MLFSSTSCPALADIRKNAQLNYKALRDWDSSKLSDGYVTLNGASIDYNGVALLLKRGCIFSDFVGKKKTIWDF